VTSYQDGLVLLTLRFVVIFKEAVLLGFFCRTYFQAPLCLCVVMRLVVETFVVLVAVERCSTSLQLQTEPILRQQCTVAVALVLLIFLLRRWTL